MPERISAPCSIWMVLPLCEIPPAVFSAVLWSNIGSSYHSRQSSNPGSLKAFTEPPPFQQMAGSGTGGLVQKFSAFSYPSRNPKSTGRKKHVFHIDLLEVIIIFCKIIFISIQALELLHMYHRDNLK